MPSLIQLFRLRAEDIPQLLKWLDKQSKKHTAHENQNEILEIMAHRVLREILDNVSKSPFLAVMEDETTDQSNIEQLTLVIRCVDDDFCVSEEFLGLYSLAKADANRIVSVLLDALLRFQIPLSKLCGQCYDGCSTMAGTKSGVAADFCERAQGGVHTLLWARPRSRSQ